MCTSGVLDGCALSYSVERSGLKAQLHNHPHLLLFEQPPDDPYVKRVRPEVLKRVP